jgi:hypothetical protein
VKAKGIGGELRFKYQTAATLGRWSLETIPPVSTKRYMLVLSIASHVYPWCQRTPLDVYLSMGNRQWQWCTVPMDLQGKDEVQLEVRGVPVIHAQGAVNGESVGS